MRKITKFFAGVLATLGMAAVVSTAGVNAAAGDTRTQTFQDSARYSSSTSAADGWTTSGTNGTSEFGTDKITVTKFLSPDGYLLSPKLANGEIASTASITITAGTTGTSSAMLMTVYALNDGSAVANGSMYTPASKALGSATTTSGGSTTTLTLNATAFNQIKIAANGTKQVNISDVSITYTLTELSAEDIENAKVASAVTAINAIGTVTYSETSKTKIATAKSAVDACASTASISNYDTYTSAVTTYDTAKDAAASAFTTAVSNLGDTPTKTQLDDAFAKYNVILVSDRTDAIKTSFATYRTKNDSYMTSNAISLANSFDVSDLTTGATYDYAQLGNSIFTAISDSDSEVLTVSNQNRNLDGVSYTKRMYTNGAGVVSADSLKRCIRVNAPSAGKLSIVALGQNNADSNRKIKLFNASYTEIGVSEGCVPDSKETLTGCTINFDIPSAGVYYFTVTDGISFYGFEFTSASIGYQYNNDTTPTAVRIVAKINVADLTNVSAAKLVLTATPTAGDPVVREQEIDVVYTEITGLTSAATAGVYYYAYEITNIGGHTGVKLDAKIVITISGVTHTASINQITLA